MLAIGIGRPELHRGAIRRDLLQLHKAFHHGVPNNACSLAYDVVQKIIAIGTRDGLIKIMGKPGIELILDGEHRTPVRFLHFVTNTGHLVAMLDHSVEVWDLETREVIGTQAIDEKITAFHLYPESKYLLVGTEEGSVRVIDIEGFHLSTYKIASKKVRKDVSTKNRSPVKWLAVAPDSDGSVLIAYADGLISLWNLKQQKVARHYELHSQPLEACAWHPEGKFFITGYEDGELCLWKAKAKKPLERFYVSSSKAKRTPIKRIVWTKCAGEDMIIVQGGTTSHDPGLTILQGMGPPNPYRMAHIPCPEGDVEQFVVHYSSPWEGGDPVSLLMLTESGHFQSNVLSRSLGFPMVTLPPSLIFQDSRIAAAQLYPDASKLLFHDLFESGNIRFDPSYWLATGGKFAEKLITGRDLLVTCHDSGKIRFWDASSVALRLLLSFYVGDDQSSAEERRKASTSTASGEVRATPQFITVFHFCPVSRILVLGCLSGSIFFYKFTSKPCKYERLIYRPPQPRRGPPPQQPTDAAAARPKGSPQTAPAAQPPTSPAKAAEEPPAGHPKSPPVPAQPPAPLPPVGTEAQPKGPPVPAVPVVPTHSQTATPTKKVSAEAIAAKSPPGSPQVAPAAPPPVAEAPSKPSTFKAGTGFYLAMECLFDSVIKSVAYLPKYNLLAIGDQNGFLTIVDTRTASRVLGAAVAQQPEPITSLTWAEAVGDEADEMGNMRKVKELLLLVGIEGGFVTVVTFRGSRVFFNPRPFEKKQPSPINHIAIVDARGKPYRIRAPKWKEVDDEEDKKKSKKGKKGEEQHKPREEHPAGGAAAPEGKLEDDWVEVDERKKPREEEGDEQPEQVELRADRSWKGAHADASSQLEEDSDDEAEEEDPSKMGMRFLLLCAEESLCIYTVPDYDQLARVETKHPILSSHIVSLNGEYCLVCFTGNNGLTVYSLMDLTPLMETTLDRFSLNTNATMLRNASVLVDGRMLLSSLSSELHRLSLFAGENSLDLPHSLPTVHIRGIVLPERPKGLLKSLFGTFDLSIFAEVDKSARRKEREREEREREPERERARDHRERDAGDHDARQKLFEGRDSKAREKYERGGEGNERVRDARKGVAGLKDQMNRNAELLNERGEKLSELAQKTAEMEDNSSEFYANAKKLADKYKNKKWYEF